MKTEELIQLIGCCSSEVLPVLVGHNFKPTDQLCELGANSVDRAEIIVLLMERLSLRIPKSELHGPKNIGELANLLQEKIAPSVTQENI